MCDQCEALKDEIAYLRERLGEQLNQDLVRILMKTFGFSCGEAKVVTALHQARGVLLSPYAIGDLVRDHALGGYDGNTVQVWIMRIRKKTCPEFIITYRSTGYALSDDARRQVAAAIEADKVKETYEPDTLRAGNQWTGEAIGELARLHFDKGFSFSECARRLGKSRNACIGAANRYLRQDGEARFA